MSADRIRLRVIGGAREVGANSYLLSLGSRGLLLDAGLHPRRQGVEALPAFGEPTVEVEEIFISHAHLDHVGALPVALKRFPRARVHLSGPTAPLAIRMLRNAVAISRGRSAGGAGELRSAPLYNDEQVEWVEQVVRPHAPGERFSLAHRGGSAPSAVLFNAGHLLGAAGLLVEHGGRRLFYTGDTCASAQLISCAARYPEPPIDLLLMDSTHGADPSPHLQRDERGFETASEELGEFISTVAARGGSILVPVFALGRCQEILGVLHALRAAGKIPTLPIYISGLAHAMTRIYDAARDSERVWRRSSLALEEVGYRVLNAERWNDPTLLASPCILAISSGMMFAGTGSHLLAGRMLPDPRHGIAFVGFLDPESPGYRVAQAARGERVDLGPPFGEVEVACAVRHQGFTGHSRASQLLATVERLRPRRTVLVHGDGQAVDALAERIRERGVPTEVVVATPDLEVDV